MKETYTIYAAPSYRGFAPDGKYGDWLVRVYDEHGEHVHSAEGGVPLEVGLREAARAIERAEADGKEEALSPS